MNKSNGYFKVKIGGRERPFKRGMNADALYCELKECNMQQREQDYMNMFGSYDLDKKGKIKMKDGKPVVIDTTKGNEFRDFIYCGLVDGARYERKINPNYNDLDGVDRAGFSQFDIGDWIDDMDQKELGEFVGSILSASKSISITENEKKQTAQEEKK